DEAKTLKTPWLGIFGDRDQGIPVEDVEKLRAELDRTNPVPHEILRYDADHGFHCDGRPAVYDEAAAKDAWSRTLDWFGRHLRSPAREQERGHERGHTDEIARRARRCRHRGEPGHRQGRCHRARARRCARVRGGPHARAPAWFVRVALRDG